MIIVHRCQGCGHLEQEHERRGCSAGYCQSRCKRAAYSQGPSEAVRTYAVTDPAHAEVLAVTAPGEVWRPGGPPVRMCGCPECQDLANHLGAS